ncbi:hypothetical protein CR157_14990 [Halomonas sp. LBP4]|nr:hypothetical protein CR157_14990 [Halomonas sp. LBP4]
MGFTGSRNGGLALMATAQARPQPIPVYAEMSSINPVFCCPRPSRRATRWALAGWWTASGSNPWNLQAVGTLRRPSGRLFSAASARKESGGAGACWQLLGD